MRRLAQGAFAAAVMLSCSGCAIGLAKSLHEYSQLDYIDPKLMPGAVPVSYEEDRTIILSFSFDTDYVGHAYHEFLAKCPNRHILNVRTRYSTDLGFFAFKHKIKIDGLCLQSASAPAKPMATPKT